MTAASVVDITPVEDGDIPVLTDILIQAMEPDVLLRFMFSERREKSVIEQKEFFGAIFQEEYNDHRLQRKFAKATHKESGKIVGWLQFTWYEGNEDEDPQPPDDGSFKIFYKKALDAKYHAIMKGRKHASEFHGLI